MTSLAAVHNALQPASNRRGRRRRDPSCRDFRNRCLSCRDFRNRYLTAYRRIKNYHCKCTRWPDVSQSVCPSVRESTADNESPGFHAHQTCVGPTMSGDPDHQVSKSCSISLPRDKICPPVLLEIEIRTCVMTTKPECFEDSDSHVPTRHRSRGSALHVCLPVGPLLGSVNP